MIFIIVRKMYNCDRTCSSEYAERPILQSVTKYNEYVQSTSDIFERIPSGLEGKKSKAVRKGAESREQKNPARKTGGDILVSGGLFIIV